MARTARKTSKQISDIESLISKNIDVLVVDPATSSVSPGVREACMRGITTVVYDRFVTAQTPTTASMYANEVQDGYNGGQAIVKALNGKGNVVIIPGIAGAGVTEDRVKGAKLAMSPRRRASRSSGSRTATGIRRPVGRSWSTS